MRIEMLNRWTFVLWNLCVSTTIFGTAELSASDREGVQFFEQRIRPVLIERCYGCHSASAEKLKGGLYLDSKEGMEKGGDSGSSLFDFSEPANSLFVRVIQHRESGMEMPPAQPKLSDAVIADMVAWIKMGAPDPRDGKVDRKRADKSWWSLQPLRSKFDHTNIDGFIDSSLSQAKLARNPPATARVLARRLFYDLTGLPPSPTDIDHFEKAYSDDSERAVEQLIDRLLDSPRYGEHWGRHWLDVIRFGESNGFERNFIIDDLWPLRDYVIRSFNEDKPFNQLIVEHLAGDVIGKNNPSVEVASAYLVAGPFDDVGNQSIEAQKNIRAATLDEIITTTSGAFLGLTVNCARCHHHKFDPIPSQDYYRMRAVFEGVTHGRRILASDQEKKEHEEATKGIQAEIASLIKERDAIEDAANEQAKHNLSHAQYARPKIDVYGTDEFFDPIEARYVRFVIHASTSDYQQEKGRRTANPNSGRLTEFQVWTAETSPRNVALAANGASAQGAKSQFADDFPEAYGPQLCIDGQFGEQWFIGKPSVLTITLAQVERINKVTFINARGGRDVDESRVRGATPCEYIIEVSKDGNEWKSVASDAGREPWSRGHAIAKARQSVHLSEEDEAKLARLNMSIATAQKKLNAIPPLKQVWAGNFSQPTEATHLHIGGDPMKKGEAIAPASLNVLEHVIKPFELEHHATESDRRLAFARWIVSPENPITPRVLVNRVWQYHFGVGIVDTPSDFGYLGSRPSHPELLDFLSQRLIENNWRLKALHREILLSKTYQQSAQWNSVSSAIDKDARLLWRFPTRRLQAEEIRDTMLTLAGKLRLDEMGGPGFRLYRVMQNNVSTYFPLDVQGPETYRRAVYHQNVRASVVDVLNDFDLPDNAFAAPKRAATTSPAQALTMLNHSFALDMAKAMAQRLDLSDPVRSAFSIAFQRKPTDLERDAAQRLIEQHGLLAFCRAVLNSNEVLYLE